MSFPKVFRKIVGQNILRMLYTHKLAILTKFIINLISATKTLR